ncbi:hypothetical protein [Paenibacillus aceris]|uniref:Uncharacterized protein n=1 Tax=Paenibacillus aceris TaxID=869555 RepID=A0ABS4I1T8_9BACL|nr:hypothetical protein [Paenibacillus aceris]MBP1964763.1 hypothetical protein [Paenibacillus aceris]NHW33745.1 hypothetical protein [Paenibacillus aceris]
MFCCALLLSACGKNIEKQIEEDLVTITTDPKLQFSSNPYVNITNNKKSYDDIVRHGEPALPYLVQTLKASENNGLKEWVMAYACMDILGEKNPVKEWATGKEWLNSYELGK